MPDRPAVVARRQRPGRDRERQVPRQIQRSGFRVLQGDAIARRGRDAHRLPGSQADGLVGDHQIARSQGRDFGGIALRIGRRGRDYRQPAGAVKGIVKIDLARPVGRLPERPEIILGLPRPARSPAGLAKMSMR